MIRKKAQHEIAGFALIVLVVAIIGLIFLALALRGGEPVRKTSAEISDFLQASMYHTTDCVLNNIPNYLSLQNLIKTCYNDNSTTCFNGDRVCEVLNTTLDNIIKNGLRVGEQNPNKAYKLNMYFDIKDSTIPRESILQMQQGNFGNCSSIIGSSYFIPYIENIKIGNIWIELDLCKS